MKNLFIIIITVFTISCGTRKNEKVHRNDELPSLSYTIYSEKTELFAEFRTPVAGDTLSLAGHFTQTGEFFTAINEGEISLTLTVNGSIVSQTSKVSSSPGIFRYAIVPEKAGIGKMTFDIKTGSYTDRVIIDSVTVYTDEETALASKSDEEGNGNEIIYLKEQAWKIEFANIEVQPGDFYEIIKTSGEILPAQGDEMVVIANTSGIVTFSGNNAVVGKEVNAGQMLFSISGGNLTDDNIETLFKQAKATYDKAKADYDRAVALVEENVISRKNFLEIKAKYETEQANYNNLARNYSAGGQKVVSPNSGFVKNILVTEGQYVSAGQPLASVSQNRRLVLKADVSQKYFSKLPLVTSANFKTAFDNKTYDINTLNGSLLSYGKSNDANTLFVPVTFSFDNRIDILPGSLAEVFLKLKPYSGAYVIPVSALIEEQGVFYVYVQTAGESFVKREVSIGGSDGINVNILSGVNEGERVVTKGAYNIKLASATGTIPAHGHAH